MVRRTNIGASEDSARCHAREPAARSDYVVNDFSGNTVDTVPSLFVDMLARGPGASYTKIIRCTKV